MHIRQGLIRKKETIQVFQAEGIECKELVTSGLEQLRHSVVCGLATARSCHHPTRKETEKMSQATEGEMKSPDFSHSPSKSPYVPPISQTQMENSKLTNSSPKQGRNLWHLPVSIG